MTKLCGNSTACHLFIRKMSGYFLTIFTSQTPAFPLFLEKYQT
ncbi:hypothetical protein MHA_0747 [Mannheimia haemolytica PHL213]|nr:hypothetical protein MHH_c03210 [Mannheimia haemolytica M42548]EDN73704.1 hypothetical protein MHA_0747 [Mannheimia haemolytica PHL213]